MSELSVPLDYEQLPELWQLRKALSARTTGSQSPKQIEAAVSFIFHRLFVTLGYLAKSTNKPGALTETGAMQFRQSLEPLFGEDCNIVSLLADTQLLKPLDGGEWFCGLFAKLNAHLSGDYKPGHIKGNVNSRLSASMKNISAEAYQQMRLLPAEVFRKQNNEGMDERERQSAIFVIKMLDRCLMRPPRGQFDYSAGLMATANAITEKHDREKLRTFYFWLGNHKDLPELPKTADEILKDFDKHYEFHLNNP